VEAFFGRVVWVYRVWWVHRGDFVVGFLGTWKLGE
jgi:hypothetical protein